MIMLNQLILSFRTNSLSLIIYQAVMIICLKTQRWAPSWAQHCHCCHYVTVADGVMTLSAGERRFFQRDSPKVSQDSCRGNTWAGENVFAHISQSILQKVNVSVDKKNINNKYSWSGTNAYRHSSKNKRVQFGLHLLDIKPLRHWNCLSSFQDKQLLQTEQSDSNETLSENNTTKVRNPKWLGWRGGLNLLYLLSTLPFTSKKVQHPPKQPKWHIRSRISNLQRYEKINKGDFSLSLLYRFQIFPCFFVVLLGQEKTKDSPVLSLQQK